MTTITIDAREAGTGKTTQVIYPAIKKNVYADVITLVVVPSILLQTQYKSDLISNGINSKFIQLIDASDNVSATSKLVNILEADESAIKVIIITHSAFKLIDYKKTRVNSIRLILDEVFSASERIDFVNAIGANKKNKKVQLDFKLSDRIIVDPEYQSIEDTTVAVPITIKKLSNISSCVNEETERKLTAPNYIYSITKDSLSKLTNPTTDIIKLPIFADFDTTIFTNFESVHIAAANFEHQELARLMIKQNIHYSVIHAFNGHRQFKGNIIIHAPIVDITTLYNNEEYSTTDRLSLSMYWKTANPEAMNKINEYWASKNSENYIMLKNVKDTLFNDNDSYEAYEIKNNCHGLNQFSKLTAGLFTTAIRPNTNHATHLKNTLGYQDNDEYLAKSAEIHYQSIMRLALRNIEFNGTINICIMDGALVDYLISNYFYGAKDKITVVEFVIATEKKVCNDTNTRRTGKKFIKEPKKVALTNAERAANHRAKKKAEQQAKLKELFIN